MTEGGGSKRIAFVTLGYGSYSPTFLLCTSVKGSEFLACTCIIGRAAIQISQSIEA